MKLLLLLNENKVGGHADIYRAVDNCIQQGIINEKLIYPFLAKLTEGIKEKEVLTEIINISKTYKPDLILWLHTEKFKVGRDIINELRALENKPVLGYWDGDLYQSPYKPVPAEMLELTSACDVAFAQGFGEMTDKMKRMGCKDIRLVPAFGDEKCYFPVKMASKEYDIVMIANNITSMNPFRKTMPGTRLRIRIVEELSKRYKNKFAIFGGNWKGVSSKGVSIHCEQHKVYSKGRITLSINNCNGMYYFSNRLPIAMLSGIPVIQNYEEGLKDLFRNCSQLTFFKDITEALEKTEELLCKPQEELDEIGLGLRDYAKKFLTTNFAFEYMIKVLISLRAGNNTVTNPWINSI
jgi:spore maturation protein CgeB